MIGYERVLADPHEPSLAEAQIEARLQKAEREGVVARGQFDTGRGRYLWWNGWPGKAMRQLVKDLDLLIQAERDASQK